MNRNKENYKNAINQIHPSEEQKNQTFEKIVQKKKSKRIAITRYVAACAVFAICLSVGAFYVKEKQVTNPVVIDEKPQTIANAENDLPRFKDMEQLKEVIKTKGSKDIYKNARSTLEIEDAATTADSTTNEAKSDFSQTNTQVGNVDEADIVKTDGKYIYYVAQEKVYIINSETLKQESVITLESDKEKIYPSEIYINKNKLIVLVNGNMVKTMQTDVVSTNDEYKERISSNLEQMARAIVYDISDKENPKQVREVAIDGYYVNSRMIGDNLYFISSKNIWYYDGIKDDNILPIARDTAVSEENQRIDCTKIAYFEGTKNNLFTMVAGFNTEKNEPATTETFYGASGEVYASENNLYIASVDYSYNGFIERETYKTTIYKFNFEDAKIKLQCKTEMEGNIKDQFSIDEYDGNLRVATTLGSGDKTENRLYIYDKDLNEISKIDNMANGEKIYSVRFIGKVGYIVTFKEIDPLFVIDLSDPTKPEIKGELKIPGYSSYLHPYDETHIIGIGYNTDTTQYGNTQNTSMKMSMFDVSDLENPKEMFSVDIGNKYAYSEITSNHKALFYNKAKNLIGFPVTITDYNTAKEEFALYTIDLEKGFVEYGKIEQNKKDWRTNIKRGIYIGDNFYILAETKITKYSLETLEKIDEIKLD